MMWYYYSPVGTFIITHAPEGDYGLWLDTRLLGHYPLPEAAAEAVRLRRTGAAAWDALDDTDPPPDLDHWMMVRGQPGME